MLIFRSTLWEPSSCPENTWKFPNSLSLTPHPAAPTLPASTSNRPSSWPTRRPSKENPSNNFIEQFFAAPMSKLIGQGIFSSVSNNKLFLKIFLYLTHISFLRPSLGIWITDWSGVHIMNLIIEWSAFQTSIWIRDNFSVSRIIILLGTRHQSS